MNILAYYLIIIALPIINAIYDHYIIEVKKIQITTSMYGYRNFIRAWVILSGALLFMEGHPETSWLLFGILLVSGWLTFQVIFSPLLNHLRGNSPEYLSNRGYDLKIKNIFNNHIWLYYSILLIILVLSNIYIITYVTIF